MAVALSMTCGARSGGLPALTVGLGVPLQMRAGAGARGYMQLTTRPVVPSQKSTVIGFPNYNAPLIDLRTGLLTHIGIRFMQAIWERTGGTDGT